MLLIYLVSCSYVHGLAVLLDLDRCRVFRTARQQFLGQRLKVLLDGQELVSSALRLVELLGVCRTVEVENLGTHVFGNGGTAEGRTDKTADNRCVGVRCSGLLDAESESLLVVHTFADPAKEVERQLEHVLELVQVLADIPFAQDGGVVAGAECGHREFFRLFEPGGQIVAIVRRLVLRKLLRLIKRPLAFVRFVKVREQVAEGASVNDGGVVG